VLLPTFGRPTIASMGVAPDFVDGSRSGVAIELFGKADSQQEMTLAHIGFWHPV